MAWPPWLSLTLTPMTPGLYNQHFLTSRHIQMKFTPRQLSLMRAHGVAAREVLDARGMTRAERVDAFATGDYLAAVRGRPFCGNVAKRHTSDFWSTSDHCVECHPQNIQHQKKYRQPGHIYIAVSSNAGVTKIGVSEEDDLKTRIGFLNSQSYAGANDWKLVESYYVEAVGRVERMLIELLKAHQTRIEYVKAGRKKISREVFACSPTKAKQSLDSLF